jgi:hypothetical protein
MVIAIMAFAYAMQVCVLKINISILDPLLKILSERSTDNLDIPITM